MNLEKIDIGINLLDPTLDKLLDIDTSIIEAAVEKNQHKWSLVQHTDKNGVTHIEVESSDKAGAASPSPHLVTGEPRSLVSFSPQFMARGLVRPATKAGDRSKFARELESILSSEVKRRGEAGERPGPGRQETEGSAASPFTKAVMARCV